MSDSSRAAARFAAPSRPLALVVVVTLAAGVFGGAAMAASAAPASVAPIAVYSFDSDTGSTIVDSSGHGNDATWVGTPGYVAGVSGSGAAVSAGANYVKLPLVAGATDGSGSFSYEFWMNETSRTSYGTFVSNQDFDSCNNAGITLYNQTAPGALQACWGATPGGAKKYVSGISGDLTNAWHHIAVTVDRSANRVTFYVDGVKTVQSPSGSITSATVLKSGYAFNIGGLSGSEQDAGDGYTNAAIDDVRFFDAAISAEQVAADYGVTAPTPAATPTPAASPSTVPTATPVASYSFDADNGTTIVDSSGHGNDAAWVGTPGYVEGISGRGAVISNGRNYLKLPLVAGATDGSGSFSYEFWMNETSRTSYGTLVSNQDFVACNNPGMTLYNNASAGVLEACWGKTAQGDRQYVHDISDDLRDGWHHVAVAVDRTVNLVTFFVDGVSRAQSAADQLTASTLLASGYAFNIGGLSGSEQDVDDGYTNATIDDVRFFDVALAAAQVKTDFDRFTPPQTYVISYNGNGAASGSTAAQTVALTATATLSPNGFSRPGYAFAGWATSDAGPVVYTDGQSVSNLASRAGSRVTLSAVWARYRAAGDAVAPLLSYDFDTDTGAAVLDSSGNGNDGTWSGTPSYVSGVSGTAAYANSPAGSVTGVNRITLPLIAGKTDGSGSFSFAMWLKETSSSVDSPIFSNQDFTHCRNKGMTVYNTAGRPGILRACLGQDSNNPGTPTYVPDVSSSSVIGAWHQVAFVLDRAAGTATTYVDGVQTAVRSGIGATYDLVSGHPFVLGADGGGTDVVDGFVNAAVDSLDFYPQAIPAAQILNEYQAAQAAVSAAIDDGSTVASGFVSDTVRAPAVRAGGVVTQSLAGLWNGRTVTSYRKLDGDAWLSVGADGVVAGVAPADAPADPASLTVEATDGTVASRIFVEIPVLAGDAAVPFTAATWNLWDGGAHVADATRKNLAVLAANGLDVVGLQEDDGVAATRLATALGWNAVESSVGGLGIISPYPLGDVHEVAVAGRVVGLSATAQILGRATRVWTLGLDFAHYGPEAACTAKSAPDQIVAAEKATPRYAEAQQLAVEIGTDKRAAARVPVIVLGDLGSPFGSDWTDATAASHCGIGAVDWPVTASLRDAGVRDSFRVAHPDPAAAPGNTWSPVVKTGVGGDLEPQDRIDAVLFDGDTLLERGSNTLVAGAPSPAQDLDNAWASDHRAVVASFSFSAPAGSGGGSASAPDSGVAVTPTAPAATNAEQPGGVSGVAPTSDPASSSTPAVSPSPRSSAVASAPSAGGAGGATQASENRGSDLGGFLALGGIVALVLGAAATSVLVLRIRARP